MGRPIVPWTVLHNILRGKPTSPCGGRGEGFVIDHTGKPMWYPMGMSLYGIAHGKNVHRPVMLSVSQDRDISHTGMSACCGKDESLCMFNFLRSSNRHGFGRWVMFGASVWSGSGSLTRDYRYPFFGLEAFVLLSANDMKPRHGA